MVDEIRIKYEEYIQKSGGPTPGERNMQALEGTLDLEEFPQNIQIAIELLGNRNIRPILLRNRLDAYVWNDDQDPLTHDKIWQKLESMQKGDYNEHYKKFKKRLHSIGDLRGLDRNERIGFGINYAQLLLRNRSMEESTYKTLSELSGKDLEDFFVVFSEEQGL